MSVQSLTPLQQAILDAVRRYPGQFSPSGLAKMLVGAKSWQDKGVPEYGRFAKVQRKDVGFQVEILIQQGHLGKDGSQRLIVNANSALD